MEIIKVNIDDITPYEKNAKLHPQSQINQIKESILEFGNNDPIAIDENNVIIEGHGRYYALKELGYDEVECIRLSHLDEEQKKAYILVHNKLTMNTDFDFTILDEELDNILTIDMEKYGFDLNLDDIEVEDFKDDSVEYFTKDEIKEDIVNNWNPKKTLKEYVADIIDIPTAKYQFNRLCQGKRDGYYISALFNPHRLITDTIKSKNIYYGILNDEKYRVNFARFIVDVADKVTPQCEYYKQIRLGNAGYQYVNEFQPYLARDIYKKYCKDGSRILNPCAGWGGRLIGLASCMFKDIEYVETDPSKETYKGLTELKDFLRLGDNYKQYNLPFEDLELEENYFDFVFTSPPYFNTELYSEDEEQSFKRNDNYESWRDNFLYVMIDKIMYAMKKGGVCMLNVGNKKYPISDDIKKHLKEKYNIEVENDDNFKLDDNEDTDAIRSSEEDFLIFKKQ